MHYSKPVALTLLVKTAHFSFCPPKIGFFRGVGGVPEIDFPLKSSYFCYVGAHAKFQNCSINLSGRNSPFRLFPPKIVFIRGVRGNPKI